MPLTPFLYPQAQHRRQLHPPAYASYTRYKPFLKQEFSSHCVYCRLPDGMQGADNFGVDHYRPRSKFPALETVYTNLFYACNGCNRRKGAFWPTDAQLRAREFIPNPCEHIMFEHLRYRVARVEPRSPAGELAERMLMLNDKGSVAYRELVLDLIALLEKQSRQVQETIRHIDQLCVVHPERSEQLATEKVSAETELVTLQNHLQRIAGATSL